jgi:hypothetical protein
MTTERTNKSIQVDAEQNGNYTIIDVRTFKTYLNIFILYIIFSHDGLFTYFHSYFYSNALYKTENVEIRLERLFKVEPELLYQAWTDERFLKQWFMTHDGLFTYFHSYFYSNALYKTSKL